MLFKFFPFLLSMILLFLSFISLNYLFVLSDQSLSVLIEFTLMVLGNIRISFPMFFDVYSLSFSASVSAVASAVILFSFSYMKNEKFNLRFHFLVLLFIISMILLIFSPNLISLLMGWDGLGVTSYLLVIYFNSHKSMNAGLITALTNRLGDCFILISIAILISVFPLNFFFYHSASISTIDFFMFLLVLAATTKSAQIPFSAWLPAAMAAPTPVSSLVHSSTLVTAGVYLMIRFEAMINSTGSNYLMTIGIMTLTMASLSALLETDLKKIVALSTLSQLGLMMVSVGASVISIALFHLLAHAYFKAMLFMSVGNMIHLADGNQDLRLAQVSSNSVVMTPAYSVVANMSLMGMPFMAGFYSKDMIIEKLSTLTWGGILIFLLILSISLTAGYSVRFMMMLIWAKKTLKVSSSHSDNDIIMFFSMGLLWGLAISGGALINWMLMPFPEVMIICSNMKIIILIMIMSGAMFGAKFFSITSLLSPFMGWSMGSLWSLPYISGQVSEPGLMSGEFIKSFMDLKWIPLFTISFMKFVNKMTLMNSFYFMKTMSSVLSLILFIFLIYLY